MRGSQLDELRRRNAETIALFKGSLIVSASLSREEIQDNILDLLEDLYESSLSFIMLYGSEGDILEVTAYRGKQAGFLSGRTLRVDEDIVKSVLLEKEILMTSDILSDQRIPFRDELSKAGIKSVLCVPLVVRGNAIGLMGLCLPHEEHEDKLESTGRLLATFARQAAIAIENMRLYEELESANREITEWNERLQQRVDETTGKLIAARARLWHAERLSTLGRLVAGFIHEINNPLYAISNYAQQLTELESDPAKLKYLGSISYSVNAIRGITEDLSELTRLSSLSKYPNDINELLSDTLTLLEFDAQEQGVLVKCEFDDCLPPVECDAVKLRQVFLNLLINALDAMPEGGTLTVKTQQFPGHISIKFSDTGIGIDSEEAPHIFEPFFSTKDEDGIGLGLFVSSSIIQAHDGILTFDSEKGVGTCFEVRLPVGD